jgi:hypothetical protein
MLLGTRRAGGLVNIALASGGSGYATQPSVTFIGGGGTGAAAVVHMAGTAVESVQITNAGTGYTSAPTVQISGGSGSGAAATASVYAGSLRPMTFFKGRYNDMYGVDGMGRGIRWDGDSASVEAIGLQKPAFAPVVSASSSGSGKYVAGAQIVNAGAGYHGVPTVTITGGSPSRPATADAYIQQGRLVQIAITDRGAGYQSTPNISVSGGIGTGATFSTSVIGRVSALTIAAAGTGYTANATTSPTVVFSSAQGLTEAVAQVSVDFAGKISGINLLSGGTGATTAGVTATIVGGGGTGAELRVGMQYAVSAVSVGTSGSGYHAAPVISFQAASSDSQGFGAAATASVNGTGNVTGVTVYAGGQYAAPPTALVLNTEATATATLAAMLGGKYKCAIRYLDDTPESQGGPIPSSISHVAEVDAGESAGGIVWSFSHSGLDDRVKAMELWRTSSGQDILFYRVATIQRDDAAFTSTYTDTLAEQKLTDVGREGYGLMPLTLPSGQVNARRFQIPPGEFAVACMFQDRAWYAVDTSGVRPNALMYSEIDEPESVPAENELILQENTGDTDRLVALIPLGSELLLAQRAHLYRLNYVSQPVIDASIILAAYRGVLNNRCWSVIGGVAFLVDSYGMYAFDGGAEEPVSVPVDNYWRDGIIDMTKSESFHVRSDVASRVVRFYYCRSADAAPTRALCYCIATKAWWEEQYPVAVTATCPVMASGSRIVLEGTATGAIHKRTGITDAGQPIPYSIRTGAMPLIDEKGSRSIGVVYSPTSQDADLLLSLHYNNSASPRPSAISSDTGSGVVSTAGGTQAQINMKSTRSPLGDSNGTAVAFYSGRVDPRSSGGDRHIAVALAGTQSTDAIKLYSAVIEGVT